MGHVPGTVQWLVDLASQYAAKSEVHEGLIRAANRIRRLEAQRRGGSAARPVEEIVHRDISHQIAKDMDQAIIDALSDVKEGAKAPGAPAYKFPNDTGTAWPSTIPRSEEVGFASPGPALFRFTFEPESPSVQDIWSWFEVQKEEGNEHDVFPHPVLFVTAQDPNARGNLNADRYALTSLYPLRGSGGQSVADGTVHIVGPTTRVELESAMLLRHRRAEEGVEEFDLVFERAREL